MNSYVDEEGIKHKVGSINAEVFHIERVIMAKKKYLLDVAYSITTEESAKSGDYAETGMFDTGLKSDSLKEMAQYIVDEGGAEDSGSGYISSVDPLRDYKTGDETFYTFHSQNLTVAEHQKFMGYFWKAMENI